MDSDMIVAYAHRVTSAAKWGIGITLAVAMALSCAVGAAVYLIVQETRQQALLREGYQAVRSQEWETAIAKFDRVLPGRLTSAAAAEAYANRAWCYGKRSQRDEAFRDYAESIRRDRRVAWVFDARGILHQENGEAEKALQDFTEVIRLDPNATHTLHRRARIFFARGEVEKGIDDLKEAIRTRPDDAELHAELGDAQLRAE
jgi:tetratricopeptide (TPR) repeat protein